MLELAAIMGILTGYIRGGALKHLAKFNFLFYYLILIAFFIQFSINYLMRVWPNQGAAYLLLVTSYLLIITAVWFNRKNEFLFIVLIGLILNFLVISINGGMPVSFGAAEALGVEKTKFVKELALEAKHVVMVEATKLKILGDIIPIPKPYPLPGIFSIGDVFISAGIFFFLQHHMRYQPRHRKISPQPPAPSSQN